MSAASDRAIQQADTDAERIGKRIGMAASNEQAMRIAMTQLLQETIVMRGEMRAIRILLAEQSVEKTTSAGNDMSNAGPT